VVPVILSGGSGTRMWPYSRSMYPKQFLPLVGENSMLQETILRLEGEVNPVIVCNENHRFMVAEQLRSVNVNAHSILLEPVAKNTAPAIALAALQILEKGQDDVMLVLPADHVILNHEAFLSGLNIAEKKAKEGSLVTFGIVPTYAETGYGYIRAGEGDNSRIISEFLEKPDSSIAQRYIDSGDYFWNSGMFMFKASTYLNAIEQFSPDIFNACKKAMSSKKEDLDFVRVNKDAFSVCPSDSIDYAVMEKTESGVMVPLDAGWSDVGSWASLWSVCNKDEAGNAVRGDVLLEGTSNCYVQSEDKLIATIGLSDTVIVQTDDTILVAAKDQVQEVKKIVAKLKQQGRSETQLHRKVYRPWGSYDSIDSGERFQVKRIVVKPRAKLSLQMHHHRSEHWVVVSGTAEVINGDKKILLKENESTYIPLGVTHSLSNPGTIPLEIIEVQSGSYLGEDDIVRFEDVYGRI